MEGRVDLTILENAGKIPDSDTLWNICCYDYLRNVAGAITPEIAANYSFLGELRNKIGRNSEYEHDTSYGEIYSNLMINLEKLFRNHRYAGRTYHPGELDVVLDQIYRNENQSLERLGRILAEISGGHSQTSKAFLEQIQKRLPQTQSALVTPINKQNPVTEGSMFNLGRRLVSGTFKPMQVTGMPVIRTYEYKKHGSYPTEIRMGTQAQRHNDNPEVNPIFREWVQAQMHLRHGEIAEAGICHLYINNLPRDREDFAGTKERMLTEQLEKLEDADPGLAVVTMPADKGILSHANLESHKKDHRCRDAFMQIYDIATNNSNEKIKDFHISDRVKKLLYGSIGDTYNTQREEIIISQLLTNSFNKLGIDPNGDISKAEIAAVYFHFIKYELMNFMLEKLQPLSFNTSCKDGIDRGGASSAYYNLMKSIAEGHPMSENEFNTALHAAPVLVKGRPMNEHVEHVWAAVHLALPGLKATYKEKLPRWLSDWEQRNTPKYASTHKHNKDWHIEQLMRYIEDRSDNPDRIRLLKIETAKKLVTILNKHELQFDINDAKSLSDGDLQKIFRDLINDGYLPKKYFHLQKLMEYIGERMNDPDSVRQQKVKTAEKLVRILNNEKKELLDEHDRRATSDGELLDIFHALIEDGYLVEVSPQPPVKRSNTPNF